MKNANLLSFLFYFSAAYDGLLGLAFLTCPDYIFNTFSVPPPNHFGYVQFPAALLIIFACMFYKIASDFEANKGLIIYGIMLKIAYCGVSGYYWALGTLPQMWQPFVVLDALMGAAYIWAYCCVGKSCKT